MAFLPSRASLRRQLILLTVVLVVAPLLTLAALLPWRVFSFQKQEALRLHEEIASRAANELALAVKLLENDIQDAEDLANLCSETEERQAAILSRLHAHKLDERGERRLEGLSLVAPDGRERIRLSRSTSYSSEQLRDLGASPLFQEASQTRRIAYGPPAVDQDSKEPLLQMAVPFFDAGTAALRCVIIVQVRLRHVWGLVTDTHFGREGQVFITDAGHRVIAHPDPSVVLAGASFFFDAPSGASRGLSGERVVYFAREAKLGAERVFFVAVRPEAEAYGATREILGLLLLCLVCFLLVSVGLGRTLLGRILRPLDQLAETAASIGGCDFSARAPETGPSELRQMATAFNAMLSRLGEDSARRRQAEESLKQANAELDRRVADRTATLNTTNAQLRLEVQERLEAEKRLVRYQQIVDASHDLMSFIDRDLMYRAVNKTYLAYHGHGLEGIIGHSVEELLGAEKFRNIKPYIDGALAGETQRYRQWFTYALKGKRYAEVQYIPFRGEGGEVSGVVVNVRDITEQLMMEQTMRQAEKLKAVGVLAAGIAHDFNNILNIIQGSVHAGLRSVGEEGRGAAQFTEIATASRRAAGLVRQILTFSRPARGARKRLSLSALVEETLALQKQTIPPSVTLQTDITASRGAILADGAQVHQIVANLVGNAVHAMESRGGILSVTVDECTRGEGQGPAESPTLAPGRYTRLVVADTGCGMDEETLQHAFEPFFTTKEVGKGTGLGLAICQSVVQGMGGAMTVRSAPGEGTRVAAYFPLTDGEPVSGEASGTGPSPNASAPTASRILYVDDEVMNLSNWQMALEGEGFSVTTCQSGAEALACFQKDPDRYDLLITDQRMPLMSGTELARKLSALRPDLPIILSSGWDDAEDEEKLSGIRARLEKPHTIEQLLEAITGALRNSGRNGV